MEQSKLTQEQITLMSEVVAKYMGWVSDKGYYENKNISTWNANHFFTPITWDTIHEVWEKLRNECTHTQRVNIKETLSYGTKEQAFQAIYNAIKFIQDEQQ
jgi:hypothetical protein